METAQERYGTRRHESLGALLGQLSDNALALLRDEIDLGKQIALGKGYDLVRGAIMLGIGVLAGQMALVVFSAAAVIALAPRLGLGLSAVAVASGLTLSAGLMVYLGVSRLRRVGHSEKGGSA